ncbi:MarR family winged helix-turn-helix transcriptional regulator [Fusibacter paucivorans]|uniref:MarR family winged helix-turn-helix transcriptional regulator n=1 Tax=Fusibacter paucivorans TaxID=76009 RepID=UPI0031B81544
MKLKGSILRDVGSLARAVNTINDIKYITLDLHKNQYIFLTRICENEGISLKALSIMLKVDKTTTTKAVQKLIRDGYVTKEKDEVDARVFRLFSTRKSKAVYNMIIDEENRAIDKCFEGFTTAEINTVQKLLQKMNANLAPDWYETKNYKGGVHDSE